MKLSISVALLLVVVLATATEAGWVRKALGKVGNVAKTVITHETVKGITGIVKGLGPGLVMGAIGKRSVDSQPLQGAAREAKARSLLRELELACTQFSDLQNKRGLNDADLRVAFAETDENKDGRLNSVELDLFENVVDAVQHCLDILKKPQAVQGM